MQITNRIIVLVGLLVATLTTHAFGQQPADAIATGATVLTETMSDTLALLADNYRCDPQAVVAYNGRVTANQGWTAQVQGTFVGASLTLNYSSVVSGPFFDTSATGFIGDTPLRIDPSRTAVGGDDRSQMLQFQLQMILPLYNELSAFQKKLQDRLNKAQGAILNKIGGAPSRMWVSSSVSNAAVSGQSRYALLISQDTASSCQMLIQGTSMADSSGADLVGSAAMSLQERTPPCPGAAFLRILSTTSECREGRVSFFNTLEWVCPDGTIQTTTERVQTDVSC